MFNVTLIAADWWSWLIPLVFIVIYLINHLLAGAKPAPGKQRDAQQRRRPPAGERPLRPEPARQGAPARQQAGQTQLNAEIEQFLKRANERRMEKARREAPPARSERPTPKPPLAAPPPPLREQPLPVEPLEQHDFDMVDESVRQHLGNRGFEQRAEHLADDVVQADEEMEQHLKRVFEHRLGSLSHEASDDPNAPHDIKAPITRADPEASAKALAGLLANHQNLRRAILLKEILERPVDRW